MRKEISNNDDVIDSRDIIERIKYLEGTEDESEKEELAILKALAGEAEGYAEDWKYGVTLIRESYFEDYAREFAEDIGAVDRNAKWPLGCIDWEEAAEELKQDYTSVEFDGIPYYFR